ncbi:HNH endonuclease, partial [Mycobacterium tuberculosis]
RFEGRPRETDPQQRGHRTHGRPNCHAPGDRCEVHHIDQWATGGSTDIDKLTFTCTPNHKLVGKGWQTRKRSDGQTEWIPPPHLDRGAHTNDYHHPERLFDH